MTKKAFMAHAKDGEHHLVAAQLRVLITEIGEGDYVAQGLEVDYCASAKSIQEVQKRFATGFLRTVEALIKRGRPLSSLFKSSTPPEAWEEYMESSRQDELSCATVVSLRGSAPQGFPFDSLAFCAARSHHAAA